MNKSLVTSSSCNFTIKLIRLKVIKVPYLENEISHFPIYHLLHTLNVFVMYIIESFHRSIDLTFWFKVTTRVSKIPYGFSICIWSLAGNLKIYMLKFYFKVYHYKTWYVLIRMSFNCDHRGMPRLCYDKHLIKSTICFNISLRWDVLLINLVLQKKKKSLEEKKV